MHQLKVALSLIFISALISACGGGGGGSSSPGSVPSPGSALSPTDESNWDEMKWDQGNWK